MKPSGNRFSRPAIVVTAIVFLITLFISVCCALPSAQLVLGDMHDATELGDNSITGVHDLKKEGNWYISTGNDPYLVYHFSTDAYRVIRVNFNEPPEISNAFSIRLYYAGVGKGFSEERSMTPTLYIDKSYCLFILPEDNYDTFRLDINGDFSIHSILISNTVPNMEAVAPPISAIRLIVAVAIAILFAFVLLMTGGSRWIAERISELRDRFIRTFRKKGYKKIALGALVYPGLLVIAAIAELVYFALFEKQANTLGLHFDPARFAFLFVVFATIYTLYLLRNLAASKPEYLFLTIALAGGLLFSVGMPPVSGVSWDDQTHYRWATSVPLVTEGDYSTADNQFFNLKYSVYDEFSYQQLIEDSKSQNKLDAVGSVGKLEEPLTRLYQRLGHLPSAIALKVSDTLGLSFVASIIWARIANLLIYVLLIFLAIRKLTTGKMILSVLALAPTFIFLATNFGYDYWVTAFLYLAFAYYLEELRNPYQFLSVKNLFIMLGSIVLACGPKAIYFIFFLFPLFFKRNKLRNPTWHRLICIGAAFLVVLLLGTILFSKVKSGGGDMRGGTDVSVVRQLKYILTHPFSYAKLLVRFLLEYLNPATYGNAMTSSAYLGNAPVGGVMLVLLFVVAFTDKNERDLRTSTWPMRFWVWGVTIFGAALIATALYLDFNNVGGNAIGGCQPRYLFPFYFPIFSVMGSTRIRNEIRRSTYNLTVSGLSAAILFISVWTTCLTRYY